MEFCMRFIPPYLQSVWEARYFWVHLTSAELRYKFRRSRLGLLWSVIHPIMLSLIMGVVFSSLLRVQTIDFIPYVFSGLIVWDFLLRSVVDGCNSLVSSEQYIKQFKQPLVIYPLKTTLVNIITFSLALVAVFLWMLFFYPQNIWVSLVAIPLATVLLVIIGWPIAIITSCINLKYRDFAQVMALVMQAIWYVSPVFFKTSMFPNSSLLVLLDLNPITHILNLVRAPILHGQFPAMLDFGYVFVVTIVLYILAYLTIRANEKTLVFYF